VAPFFVDEALAVLALRQLTQSASSENLSSQVGQHTEHTRKAQGMAQGYPRLLGDIGGTNARWAWQAAPGVALQHYREYACAQFESVLAVIERYLVDEGLPPPVHAAFGIATPVTGDVVQMTNHYWTFSIQELKQSLSLAQCLVLNDFAAIAAALPALTAGDVRRIGGGAAVAAAPVAVLGPGTGLGVASLVRSAEGRAVLVDGEGGHVSLAATNAREFAVIDWLQKRYGHASAERAISGPGLVSMYRAICAIDGKPALDLKPAQVSAHALPDDSTDRHEACKEALHLFGAFLGSVAGDLALTVGARGGVYIGGGIVPRLGLAFDALPFRERFEAKGRFRGYLERIPTFVITASAPALYGAANALDAIPTEN
jgi:glucokinase